MEKIEKDKKIKNEERDTSGDTKVFQIIRKDEKTEKETENLKTSKEINEKEIKVAIKGKDEKEIIADKEAIQKEKKLESIKNENLIKAQPQSIKETVKKEKNQVKPKSPTKQKILKMLLITTILALVILIFSTIFGLITANSNKIISGVKINNIEVSSLTKEEAKQKLENELNNNETNYITVKRGDYSKQIYLQDIDAKFEIENAVNLAYDIGRTDNLIENNYKTLLTMITKSNINAALTFDQELLENKINEISLDLPDLAIDASYIIEGDKLIIKDGAAGIQIQKDQFQLNMINAFSQTEKTFELPLEQAEKKEINIDNIHKEIYKSPVNAYYTTSPYKIYKEEDGLDFAITVDEAKEMLLEEKSEYEIPLKIIKPQITVADLDSGAYPDKLSTFTTTYGTADVNRNTNIAVAARSINSAVVMPGETFSYNDLIGECSLRTGYKISTIYLNGELSTGIGGGICQVSTTLYNAVLRANLEIVERKNHSLGVTYVPAGQDAMVSIGTSDLKFKNNRDYPIKVVAFVGKGSVTCQIYGLKQDTEYEVKLESRTIEKTDKKYKVETYKVLYLDGKEISRTWLSTDTYKYHQ